MNIRFVFIIALMTVGLVGCKQTNLDLQNFVSNLRSRPTLPIAPSPRIASYSPYSYVSSAQRSPFMPARRRTHETVTTSSNGLYPDFERRLEPLEAFPLDALQMVGTITADGVKYALIEAPNNMIYRPSVGDHAGKNYGEISAITEAAIILTEIVPNGAGAYIQRPATIPRAQ